MISRERAPVGRMFCNPPQILVERMIEKIASEKPDVVIVTGDFVGHKIS
jgi:predicted MPP superfamily phosphohydrolase